MPTRIFSVSSHASRPIHANQVGIERLLPYKRDRNWKAVVRQVFITCVYGLVNQVYVWPCVHLFFVMFLLNVNVAS